MFPPCSFDISSIEGINSFFISILYRDENQINYLNNIIIYLRDNNQEIVNIFQNKNTEEKEENYKLLYNQSINTYIITCIDKTLLYSVSYKNILQCNLIKLNSGNDPIKFVSPILFYYYQILKIIFFIIYMI